MTECRRFSEPGSYFYGKHVAPKKKVLHFQISAVYGPIYKVLWNYKRTFDTDAQEDRRAFNELKKCIDTHQLA